MLIQVLQYCVLCTKDDQQGHAGRKTFLQQNPPVLNIVCPLMQVVLYNGHKMVVVTYKRHYIR